MILVRIILCTLGFSTLCLQAQANLALRGKSFDPKAKVSKRKEVKFENKKVEGRKDFLNKENLAAILPGGLQANSNSQWVAERFVSRIGQSIGDAIVNSDFIQNSALLKGAKKFEESAKLDLTLNKNKKSEGRSAASTQANEAPPAPAALQAVEHKFKFDLRPTRGQARIRYSGYLNSTVEYRATSNEMVVSIEESLSDNSRLAVTHTSNSQQTAQLLQYQISW